MVHTSGMPHVICSAFTHAWQYRALVITYDNHKNTQSLAYEYELVIQLL